MKKAVLALLLMVILLSYPIAEAAKWEKTPSRLHGVFTYYVDTESISGIPPGPVDAWTKIEQTSPPANCNLAPSRFPHGLRCHAKTIIHKRYFNEKSACIIRTEKYYLDETPVEIKEYPCNPAKVVSGSEGEIEWEFIYIERAGINKK